MDPKRFQTIGFFVVLAIFGGIIVFMFLPFLQLLALAGILALLFQPVYTRLQKAMGNDTAAAFATIAVIVFVVGVPLFFVGNVLLRELVQLYNKFRDGTFSSSIAALQGSLPESLKGLVQSVNVSLSGLVQSLTANAFATVSKLISNVVGFFASTVILFFITFFFLRDGVKIKELLMDISPLSSAYENILFTKMSTAINAVVRGSFLTALIQGAVATAGYLIFGMPEPLLWGVMTAIAALIPMIGTSVATASAVLYLLLTHHIGAGVGMAVWAALAVGTIDNIVGPKLVGSRAKIHPLLVFLGMLGGIKMFGFLGFLLGPIIMAVFIAIVEIYRKDLKKYVE